MAGRRQSCPASDIRGTSARAEPARVCASVRPSVLVRQVAVPRPVVESPQNIPPFPHAQSRQQQSPANTSVPSRRRFRHARRRDRRAATDAPPRMREASYAPSPPGNDYDYGVGVHKCHMTGVGMARITRPQVGAIRVVGMWPSGVCYPSVYGGETKLFRPVASNPWNLPQPGDAGK